MLTSHTSAFGDLLRRHRLAAGLTQEALAEQARVSVRAVSDLERGVKQRPHRDTVRLLADALDLAARSRAAFEALARHNGDKLPTSAMSLLPVPAVSLPLVGRDRELALLERWLAGEGPPVLLLAGEPGIGKSRLLYEAARCAGEQGWSVLMGGCQRCGGQEPYAPLPEVVRGHIRRQRPARLRADLDGCAWLVKLLPELADSPIPPLPTWTLAPEQERYLMVAAIARFLTNIAGPGGLLLLLDDLQWADPDALDLLRALAQSAADQRLRVIAAYRDTEVRPGEALPALLADLASAGLAAHHALAPLTEAETARLVALLLGDREEIPPTARARVVERSGGVPFFTLSCVQGLRGETGGEDGAGAAAVPWTVAQSVRQRVAALPHAAQEELRVAAVYGRSARRALLLALSARPTDEALAALDAACHARLLVEDGPTAYRFAHDVVREVVEGDLSAARRAALHERVADVLEALPGAQPVEVLAYHYAQSDAADKAVRYLERAGDLAVARAALGVAEGYYRDLTQRLEALGREEEAAYAYAKLGLLLEQTQNGAMSIPALLRAEATFARRLAAQTPAQAGATLLDQYVAGGARAELYLASSVRAIFQDRLGEAMALAQRAVAQARESGDGRLQVQALLRRGIAELKSGRLDEAVETLEEARRLCEDRGGLGLPTIALNELFFVYELRGDFDQAGRCNARNLQIAETIGDPALLVGALFPRACLAIDTGDWARAHADLEHLIAVSPSFAADSYILANLGFLSMLQGEWETAAGQLQEALGRSAGIGDMNARVMVERLLAELELLQGRPGATLARLRALLDLDEVHDTVFMLPLVAWAHLRLGKLDEAEAVSEQAVARVQAERSWLVLPDALRVRAMISAERRRWGQAARALEEGLAQARRMPFPYAEGRLLHTYGLMHASKGEPEPARTRLAEALAIFQRLGARRDAEEAEQTLADLQRFL